MAATRTSGAWKPGDRMAGRNGLVALANGKNRRANVKVTKPERDVYDRCHEAMHAGAIYSWQIDHRLGCWLIKITEQDDWAEMTMPEVAELLPAPLATIHPISKLNPKESTMTTTTSATFATVEEALDVYKEGGIARAGVVTQAQHEHAAAKAARKAGKPVPATPAFDAVNQAHAQGLNRSSSKARTPGVRAGRPTVDDAELATIIREQVKAGARTCGSIDRHLRSQGIASNTKRIKNAWAACIADGMTVTGSAPVVVEVPKPVVKRAAKTTPAKKPAVKQAKKSAPARKSRVAIAS